MTKKTPAEKTLDHARLQSVIAILAHSKLKAVAKNTSDLLDSSLRAERALQELNSSTDEIKRLQEEQSAIQRKNLDVTEKNYELNLLKEQRERFQMEREQAAKELKEQEQTLEKKAVEMVFALSREIVKVSSYYESTFDQSRARSSDLRIPVSIARHMMGQRYQTLC